MTMEKNNVNMSNSRASQRRDSNFLQNLVGFFNISNSQIGSLEKSSLSSIIDEKNLTKDELVLQQYYNLSHENLWRSIPRKIRPVLKLCFACLSSTFTEFKNSKGSNKDKDDKIIYYRMMNIPLKAAYMLWLEILEIEDKTKENDNNNSNITDTTRSSTTSGTSFNTFGHSNNAVFEESLLLSSFGARNKSSILPTLTGTDYSNFENQLSNRKLNEDAQAQEKKANWEYFITKDERDELLRLAKNNNSGDVTSYIKDKLVSIGLLRVVETSTELPHNLKTLLMNSNNDTNNKNNNNNMQTNAALMMNCDDDRSIATNMNAYEDILYDDNSVWPDTTSQDPDAMDQSNLSGTSNRTLNSDGQRSSQQSISKKQKTDLITTYKIQHFQICSDELYNYGYYFLLKRNRKDYGIWMDPNKKQDDDSEDKNPLLFEEMISQSCMKLRRKEDRSNQNIRNSQLFVSLNDSFFNLTQNVNDNEEENFERYYWISLLSTSPERLVNEILSDGKMLHALRMLPTHLMKFEEYQLAISFLSSQAFIYGRLVLMGVTDSISLLKKDCQHLLLCCPKTDSNNSNGRNSISLNGDDDDAQVDPYAAIDSAYSAMRQCLISEFPILNGGEGVVGETYSGEIGKTLHCLAVNLEKLGGQRKKALQLYIDALRYKKASLGDFDLSVAHTFRCIGKIYFAQSLYQEGILLFGDALLIERQVLGKNDKRVAETMSNMALAYSMTAEYDLAISFYNQILEIEIVLYGEHSLEVAETQKCLGRLNLIIKHHDAGITYLNNSLQIYTKVYGEKSKYNLSIADVYHHLGITYDEIQQYTDALKYFKKSHEIKENRYSQQQQKDSNNNSVESIARSLHHMAKTYTKIGDVDNAITCYEKVLRIRKARFGYDHGEIARTLFDFAHTMQVAAQYELALDALNETLRIMKLITNNNNENNHNASDSNYSNADDSNSEIADVLHRIGIVFREKGDHKQALDHFRSTLDIRRKKFGNYHDDVADVLLDMGHTYSQCKSYDDAQQCYDQARDICSQQQSDKKHNDNTNLHVIKVSKALNSMGILQLELNNIDKAMEYFKQALSELYTKKELFPISEQIAETLVNIGHGHKHKDKIIKKYNLVENGSSSSSDNHYDQQQALKNYQEALDIQRSKFGSNHLIVAETMYHIGLLYVEENDSSDDIALDWFKKAMGIYKAKGFSLDDGNSSGFSGCAHNQNFSKLSQWVSKLQGDENGHSNGIDGNQDMECNDDGDNTNSKKQLGQYALSC